MFGIAWNDLVVVGTVIITGDQINNDAGSTDRFFLLFHHIQTRVSFLDGCIASNDERGERGEVRNDRCLESSFID